MCRDSEAFVSPWTIFLAYSRLGCTSFGGPIAHLGYFHEEFVVRRKWVDETTYTDVVGLCQFLPGPASSQVGFTIGLVRGGTWYALAVLGSVYIAFGVAHVRCGLRSHTVFDPGRFRSRSRAGTRGGQTVDT
jgi:chromate transporter